jgi:hypothetical protein
VIIARIICDACGNGVAHEPGATLPDGWWEIRQEPDPGAEMVWHFCGRECLKRWCPAQDRRQGERDVTTTEQTERDQLLIELREDGTSLSQIAAELGVSLAYAHKRTGQLVAAGRLEQPAIVVGADAKRYPPKHGLGKTRRRRHG